MEEACKPFSHNPSDASLVQEQSQGDAIFQDGVNATVDLALKASGVADLTVTTTTPTITTTAMVVSPEIQASTAELDELAASGAPLLGDQGEGRCLVRELDVATNGVVPLASHEQLQTLTESGVDCTGVSDAIPTISELDDGCLNFGQHEEQSSSSLSARRCHDGLVAEHFAQTTSGSVDASPSPVNCSGNSILVGSDRQAEVPSEPPPWAQKFVLRPQGPCRVEYLTGGFQPVTNWTSACEPERVHAIVPYTKPPDSKEQIFDPVDNDFDELPSVFSLKRPRDVVAGTSGGT